MKNKRRTIEDLDSLPMEERVKWYEKMEKLDELYISLEVQDAYNTLWKFFDSESIEMLDKKIEVLQKIKDGKDVSEEDFYSVLEDYPKDPNAIWD